jgi:MoxR-like ATPase
MADSTADATSTTTAKNGTASNFADANKQRSLAVDALLAHLKEILQNRFADWATARRFIVESREELAHESEPCTIQFVGVEENENERSKYLSLRLKASQGEKRSSSHILKIGLGRDENWVTLRVRKRGKGRSKIFPIFELVGEIEDGWTAGPNDADLKYRHRKFSPNVLKVWFPKSGEEEEGTLQIPLQLYHQSTDRDRAAANTKRERGEGWARFENDGLIVSLPDASVRPGLENEAAVAGTGTQEQFDIETNGEAWLPVWMSYLLYWVICNVYAKNGLLREDDGTIPKGFPTLKDYKAKRPVDLDPADVIDRLKKQELHFPWHVIESACAALNAGKNVIFTGPPGCGKSKLASFLSKQATGADPLMATASPAWTSGDLMGRYMPSRAREGLEFRKGFFLRAIGQNQRTRWLIVDEFNRADIDACFGELFSVLAGDAVELPFQKSVQGEETDDAERFEPVRIIPGGDDAETDADYLVPEEFRLIGTMNDADRSGLNNLSYALMRRFAIIPVEAPDSDAIKEIIDSKVEKITDELQLDKHAWNVDERGETRCALKLIEDEVTALFARTKTPSDLEGRSRGSFQNLVSEAVVGVSVVADLLRFVGEGLRAEIHQGKLQKTAVKDQASHSNAEWAKNLTLSYLALGVVLQVYPQLEALEVNTGGEKNRLLQAIQHIFNSFHQGFSADKLLMLRVSKSDNGYKLESDETISEFLFRNLQTRFPHQAEGWKHELSDYLSDEG